MNLTPHSAPLAADLIRVVPRAAATPFVPGKPWKYLNSTAFEARYVLASHYLKPCRSVIEIGGAVTTIDRFLTGDHESVIVVDPSITPGESDTLHGARCRVSHVKAQFQDVDWVIPPGADYGLAMLGLTLMGLEAQHYSVLYDLVDRAKVTVIEFDPLWEFPRQQFERIRDGTRTRVALQLKLDLRGNDFGDLEGSFPPRGERALYVLEPT